MHGHFAPSAIPPAYRTIPQEPPPACPSLLGRPLLPDEQSLVEPARRRLPRPRLAPRDLWRQLGLPVPDPLFAAIMSMVPPMPQLPEHRALCEYLLDVPGFFPYLSQPESFPRASLACIGRALLKVDPRFDARLAASLLAGEELQSPVMLHVLGVLDEISPGGRLAFVLTRIQRDCPPDVASKVALLLARRVSNHHWVDRHMSSDDARLRANVVESLWGVDTPKVRARLSVAVGDANNRVVGNALVGLHLLKDDQVPHHLETMIGHQQAAFRATAAWVIGKTGEPRYRLWLTRVLDDSDDSVRGAALRALAKFPPDPDPPALPPPPPDEPPSNAPTPAMPAPEPEFSLALDGSYHPHFGLG